MLAAEHVDVENCTCQLPEKPEHIGLIADGF